MKKKCPLCPYKYQSPNDLDSHLRKIHGLSKATIKQYSEEQKTEFAQKCARILNELKGDKNGRITRDDDKRAQESSQ